MDTYTIEQVEEFRECVNDPLYFISNYVINFGDDSDGKEILDQFAGNQQNIILAYSDIDVLLAAYVVWYAIFHYDKTVAIAAPTDVSAKYFIHKIYGIIDMLPVWLKPKYEDRLKKSCMFENNSRIVTGIVSNHYTFKGMSISKLLWLEADRSKNEHQEEFYQSIYPCLCLNSGSIIASSAPITPDRFFAKLFTNALNNKNDFNAIQIR